MRNKAATMLAAATLALAMGTISAQASCQGRRDTGTAVGAVGGGVLGNVLTHGSAGGTIAGVLVGGVAGHELSADGCREGQRYRDGGYSHHGRRYHSRYRRNGRYEYSRPYDDGRGHE